MTRPNPAKNMMGAWRDRRVAEAQMLDALLASNDEVAEALLRGNPPLLASGATTKDGESIVVAALRRQCVGTALAYLEMGGDPNRVHLGQGAFLHHAFFLLSRHVVAVVQLALEKGADVHARDGEGYTPLLRAVQSNAPDAVMDALLKHGANPHDITADVGRGPPTPALRIAVFRDLRLMHWLIKAGANPFWPPEHYWIPEDSAVVLERVRQGHRLLALLGARLKRKATPRLQQLVVPQTGLPARFWVFMAVLDP